MKNCKDISFSSSLNLKRQTKQTQKNMNISTNMNTNMNNDIDTNISKKSWTKYEHRYVFHPFYL